ncbi:glycerophosphodiester phosphodiesterase family protein [Rhizobium sp. Root1220]|uniref:glycerophosphodiester phosphodiesterase family protein n=1 Tax=Rhizobium sp. Root1220 TaxID=1736432 RepID=UPI0006F551E5|nr:glycerophosphodiester phosphodiesterase family protein [Rhizobium sp. Root1220]KQV84424.1 glycerophosphodiester phosphodiesterase [Rhizobium sp. Root1220]
MTRIASHRGGTLEFGDSTPQGFAATARMRLDEVEFDVHPTSDGNIVVHHDATLDATTDMCGAIASMTLDQVRQATIKYSSGGHPLTLDELCALYSDSHVNLRCEIKPSVDGLPYQGFVRQVVSLLERQSMLERTTFSSFLVESIDDLSKATDRPLLWLVSPPVLKQIGPRGIVELCKLHDIPEIGVHIDTADKELTKFVTEAGLHFGCWAAHTRDQIQKALELGTKVFTTDRPSLAIAVREEFHAGGKA